MQRLLNITPLGDRAALLTLGNELDPHIHRKILAVSQWIWSQNFPGIIDVVIGYSSLSVTYDPFRVMRMNNKSAFSAISEILSRGFEQSESISQQPPSPVKRIPVCYEEGFGLDTPDLADQLGLSIQQIIDTHCKTVYHVYMLGFLPGFAYMAEVDKQIQFPRKPKPRLAVPEGSVGIAGRQTGIYPFTSPGGWQIIGRTPAKMFDQTKEHAPATLSAGDNVQFYPITASEFRQYQS